VINRKNSYQDLLFVQCVEDVSPKPVDIFSELGEPRLEIEISIRIN
jgi:hypothetical protein